MASVSKARTQCPSFAGLRRKSWRAAGFPPPGIKWFFLVDNLAKANYKRYYLNASEIRELREELGLNQAEFAQLSGVHPITVSKWERNATTPTPYQNALFSQFKEGAKDHTVRDGIRDILIAAGVALAIALLLKHLLKK